MAPEADILPEDPALLQAMILGLRVEIAGMAAANRAYEALVQALKITIARLKKQRFGASSEKIEREIEQLERNRPLNTRRSGGLWRRLAVCFPGPGKQLVEALGIMVADAAEDVGKVGLRVQARQLRGLDDGHGIGEDLATGV